MQPLEYSRIWQDVFNGENFRSSDQAKEATEHYKNELLKMRKNVATIVSAIQHDMEGLTIHDITHLDALWEMASLLYRNEQKFNPTELFILGAAILVHDAGLTLAAFPNRINDLKNTQEWKDSLSIECSKLGIAKIPTDYTSLPNDVVKRILWRTLRLCHGKTGQTLAKQSWVWNNQQIYLLEDFDLRNTYSDIIGQIASSHNWPISDVQDRLNHIKGARPNTSNNWTVDTLKLACMLRLADAIHIDSRRAPLFQFILNPPTGVAKDHWLFQSKMTIPRIGGDKIIFTSNTPFDPEEADAWWICYDWIQMVNKELKDVELVMKDTQREPFACNGAANSDSPLSFSKVVPVSGWVPVDTTIKVSDVQSLVKRLGGTALYGNHPELAIRELIQNAADSIRARKTLSPTHPGKILISIENIDNAVWLSVEDNGVGMSAYVLTTSLLDFGKSFWNSDDVFHEHQNLFSKGFIPGGRFGIGFFSVFMLGEQVRVISRKYNKAYHETHRLEFRSGLNFRPVLLNDDGSTLPAEGGTRIEILLSKAFSTYNLSSDLEKMFPALDVTLDLQINGNRETIISGGDWININPNKLFERTETKVDITTYPLSLIQKDGVIYGRATVRHHGASNQDGAIVDNQGIKITTSSFFPGIVRGVPINAARTEAVLNIPKKALSDWASEQAQILSKITFKDVSEKIDAATQILCAGGDLYDMPFLSFRGEPVNTNKFKSIISKVNEYWIFYASYFNQEEMEVYKKNHTWNKWITSNIAFRISPFFDGNGSWKSGNVDRVLEISEVKRGGSYDNPVFEILRKETKDVWQTQFKEKKLRLEIPIDHSRRSSNKVATEDTPAAHFMR
jgi:hypothetical protein